MRAFHFSWCVWLQGRDQQAYLGVVLVSCLTSLVNLLPANNDRHLSVLTHMFSILPENFLVLLRFSFHLAFLGWFAFAPLMSIIAPQVGKVSGASQTQMFGDFFACIHLRTCTRTRLRGHTLTLTLLPCALDSRSRVRVP